MQRQGREEKQNPSRFLRAGARARLITFEKIGLELQGAPATKTLDFGGAERSSIGCFRTGTYGHSSDRVFGGCVC